MEWSAASLISKGLPDVRSWPIADVDLRFVNYHSDHFFTLI